MNGERAGSIVEVDELLVGLVPPPIANVRAPPIAQVTDLGIGVGVLRAQQRVCLRLDDGERVHEFGRRSGHAEGGCAAPREPDQVDRHADVRRDGVDLIGVVVEAPAPGHAWAGAVAVGLDRDEPVALRPEREDLLPLACAAHPAVEEHHRRPGAMLDNLDAAPQRRPEYRGHRHSVDRVPAAPAGFLARRPSSSIGALVAVVME